MGRTAVKTEQLGMMATVVIAFAALAALVLTGQAELRKDMRAGQAKLRAGQAELRKEMREGQAELRAGQIELREDPGVLGGRLTIVEHRADALETRMETVERRTVELLAAGSEPPAAPALPPDAPPTALPR